MNVQPLLPSTTSLVTVAEWREKADLGLMTQKNRLWRGKSECFNASYVNCHLTGPNFSNTIDCRRWKDLVCVFFYCVQWEERRVNHGLCLPRQLPSEPQIPCLSHVPAIISTQQTPEGFHCLHFKVLPTSAETLTTHQSTWPCFSYKWFGFCIF